ncbi:MAG: plasmid stabilization protein [Aquificales bacterium]|nr:plasmid stabilization protein [Aquificales bacterium]
MATITIRNLNEETKHKLRQVAAHHGHSMEEEVRRILNRAINPVEQKGLGTLINQPFEAIGGVELELPPRSSVRLPANLFDELS